MNIGMRGHDLPCQDLASLGEALAALEVPVIQLALGKSLPGFAPGMWSPGYARKMGETLARHGVHVSVLGCYINPIHPDSEVRRGEIARFQEHIRYAKFLGADMVGTETGSLLTGNPLDNRTEEAYKTLLASLQELVAYAGQLGVMVGIEPVTEFPIYCPERMRRLLDDLHAPNVCVILDPVNLMDKTNYQEQHTILEQSFALFGDQIGVLHLKDFSDAGGYHLCLAGDGMLDYPYLFSLVKRYKPGIDMILEEVSAAELPRIRSQLTAIYEQA